jgi:hypothetical protein
MKLNNILQEKIEKMCCDDLIRDPYRKQEFDTFYGESFENKNQILRLVMESHNIGLDLTTIQCFQIWDCLSAQWGCSGFMNIPNDPEKLEKMFGEAIETFLKLS